MSLVTKTKRTKKQKKTKPCSFFQRGDCKRGNKCNFSHVPDMTDTLVTLSPPTSMRTPELVRVTKNRTQSLRLERSDEKRLDVCAVNFALDVSSSMGDTVTRGNSRLDLALEGMQYIWDEVLREHDKLSVHTFNQDHKTHHGLKTKHFVDFDRSLNGCRAHASEGGATRLYDTVMDILKTIPRDRKFWNTTMEVVCLTDGRDNVSKTTFQQFKQKLAHPGVSNFHFVLVGVGLDEKFSQDLSVACEPEHCAFINCSGQGSSLQNQMKEAFRRAASGIVKRRKITVTFTETSRDNKFTDVDLLTLSQQLKDSLTLSQSPGILSLKSWF